MINTYFITYFLQLVSAASATIRQSIYNLKFRVTAMCLSLQHAGLLLLRLLQPYQKLVPHLRYTYWSSIVSYILVHIITHILCATNFIYKMWAQTSHLTRTSTCPAKLCTAINSSHNSFTFNRLDHPFLPIPHLILTGKLL